MLEGKVVARRQVNIGRKGRAPLGDGYGGQPIEGWHEGLGDTAVGFLDGGNGGESLFLLKAPLQASKEAHDAPLASGE